MRTVAGTVPSDYGQIWNTAVIHMRWMPESTSLIPPTCIRTAGQLAPLDHPEAQNSLRRWDTDWIDLYQVHRPRCGHRGG